MAKDTSDMRIERGPLIANLNTYVMVAGFVIMIGGGLIAWGYVVSEFRGALLAHTVDIERLDKRLTTVETENRQIANHELRIARMETQARDASGAMKAVETTLNGLTTDLRVIREIVSRIEASQTNSGRSP